MFKNQICLYFFILLSQVAFAHDASQRDMEQRSWSYNQVQTINGSFLFEQNDTVYIEGNNLTLYKMAVEKLSSTDQDYVKSQIKKRRHLHELPQNDSFFRSNFLLLSTIFMCILATIFMYRMKPYKRYYSLLFFLLSAGAVAYGFKSKQLKLKLTSSDPNTLDNAFVPYKPSVETHWDANYFYVENNGLPSHEMMVGISSTGWQQQVPINQCYTGSNAWSIPLNPVVATYPVNVDQTHFTRGAIAIAANGIPIFNPYTNTGVDAYLDGQLDNYGGHCGRADDYHYHVAPLFLYSKPELPIAYALDGFAVYGSLEPDGTPMQALDVNHGHYGTNGLYHYHGTSSAPYMIGKMVGEVSEDATAQIIPQATASAVRPYTSPISGALITSCTTNGNNNGYNLNYSITGQTYSVNFNWSESGSYTYNFIAPGGNTTTETYTGHTPCNFTTNLSQLNKDQTLIHISPNPAVNQLNIELTNMLLMTSFKKMLIQDTKGAIVYSNSNFQPTIEVSQFAKGSYFLIIETDKSTYRKNFIIQ